MKPLKQWKSATSKKTVFEWSPATFWHSIWHMFGHYITHVIWHSVYRFIRHSFLHLSWHPNWHLIWQSIWHFKWILPGIFWLTWILAFYLAYVLTFYLTVYLTLYPPCNLTFCLAFLLAGRKVAVPAVEKAAESHLCSNLETLTWQVRKNVNSLVKRCAQPTTWENCRTSRWCVMIRPCLS